MYLGLGRQLSLTVLVYRSEGAKEVELLALRLQGATPQSAARIGPMNTGHQNSIVLCSASEGEPVLWEATSREVPTDDAGPRSFGDERSIPAVANR